MAYKTPAALEMAIKQAAKESPQDTNRTIAGFWHHRFLCRVFTNENRTFVLKGGHAMLARSIDARATRNIDLLSFNNSLDAALEELKQLATINLGDFATFEFIDAAPIKTEDDYRNGLRVRFKCLVGARPVQDISIDLVVDEVGLDDVDVMTPADRLDVRDVDVCDYFVYPVEYTLADKLCGIIEMHNGRPSSRVKDLVDIIVIASMANISSEKLAARVTTELAVRRIARPASFDIPDGWEENYASIYAKMVKETRAASYAPTLEAAKLCGKQLFDPILGQGLSNAKWNPEAKCWQAQSETDK